MSQATPGDVTRLVASYVSKLRFEDLPDAVVHETKRALLNIMGCMLGGVSHEMIAIMERSLGGFAGPGQATVVGRGYKSDTLTAALLNGASSSTRSFDDTFAHTIVHPSGPPVAASLALAEWKGRSGRDFILAFAIGTEMTCRLSQTLSFPPAKSDIGWSQTGITGGIGAALSAARLLDLDEEATQRTIGIAASQASGYRASIGTMTTPMLTAHGAQVGLRAAVLAADGFTGPGNGLEHRYGFLSLFGKPANGSALVDGLGERFMLQENVYRSYPCGVVLQAVVEACLSLQQEGGFAGQDIAGVRIEANPVALNLADNRHPTDHLKALVSGHHWAAVSLLRGSAQLKDGSDESVLDPVITDFRNRVHMVAAPDLSVEAARVIVQLKDGTERTCFIECYAGSPSRPLSDRALEEKFIAQAGDVMDQASIQRLLERIWTVDASPDLGGLMEAASPSARKSI